MTFCQFIYFTPQKNYFETLSQLIQQFLEICDYTVCDVTNPTMTIIEYSRTSHNDHLVQEGIPLLRAALPKTSSTV